MKFILKDSLDLKIIEADSSLIAYDYPLDFEILQMGDYYHDPNIPNNQPTYHYASVKVGSSLPENVDYEILSNLYIPNPEDIGEDLADLLEDTALAFTNNLDDTELTKASKWRPAGRIRTWDDVIGGTITRRVLSHWEYYDCKSTGTRFKGSYDMGALEKQFIH